MSVKAMTWAWEQDLKPGPKFVLIALADHSDGAGVCWPGHELIADKCGLSRQTVVEHIGLLEQIGLIHAERTMRARGGQGKARYFLHLDQPSTRLSLSEKPTTDGVGISGPPLSGNPTANKDEPTALEPTPQTPRLFDLTRTAITAWFELKFWPRYPKAVRKGRALEVLLAMNPDQATLDAIAAGLEHRLAAEASARSRGQWFRAWPDAHRWLRPIDRQWCDRFDDVPRETLRDESRCYRCANAAVAVHNGKPHCRNHNPVFDEGARA